MSQEHDLTVKKVIDADRETVFKALTESGLMEQWFFAGPDGWSATVKNDFRVGGAYQIDMHGENDTYWHKGEYKEIVSNEKLVFTWNSRAVEDTVVTITLSEVEEGTEVTLIHEFMPNDEMKKNHTEGWSAILERLGRVVAGSS